MEASRRSLGGISYRESDGSCNVSYLEAGRGGAVLGTRDSELDRYRALLRDADDERKRLALIQLLIDEGARDKFAAKQQTAQPVQLPRSLPFEPQASAHPNVSSGEAALLDGGESVASESIAPKPSASEDVVSLIANLLDDKPAPAISAPTSVRVSRPTDVAPSDEIEKEITSLLKGLPRAAPSIAPTSDNEERNSILAQIQAALENLQRTPSKTRPG